MKQNNPLVFIIGGFGTKAGINIVNNLVNEYKKLCPTINSDSDVINFNLYSVTDNNNKSHFTYEECYSSFLKVINDLNAFLKNQQFTHILLCIACNTMHICIQDYLKENSFDKRIVFYSLPKYVDLYLQYNYSQNIKYSSIYLLSTLETFKKKLYQNTVQNFSFNTEIKSYSILSKIIHNIKCFNEIDLNDIKIVIKEIPDNSIVILGCTELPIIENEIKKLLKKNVIILNPHKIICQYISHDYLKIINEND